MNTQVLCEWSNGQIKAHQIGLLVLHKIPQDLFYKNHACSDMRSLHLVCCLYTIHHTFVLLFACSH